MSQPALQESAKKSKDEVQVTISLEGERKLQGILVQINDGFELARVTRKHLLAHVINVFHLNFSADDIQAVRQSALTDMALLDHLYREIKDSGVVPEGLRDFLWKSSQLTQGPKRIKRNASSKHSNAIQEDGEA